MCELQEQKIMSRFLLGIRCVLLGMVLNAIFVRIDHPEIKGMQFAIMIAVAIVISLCASEYIGHA